MLPGRVLSPGLLTYESGALPITPRGPAQVLLLVFINIIWKNARTFDFMEMVEDFDLQIAIYSHLKEYITICEYKGPRSF